MKKNKDLSKAFFEMKQKMEPIDLSAFDGPEGMFAKTLSMRVFQKISKTTMVLREGHDPEDIKVSDYEYSDEFQSLMIAESVCDSEGILIFSQEDVPAILDKSKTIFETILVCVTKMNAAVEAKEVEKKAKK